MMIEELGTAVSFVCSIQFWRMAVLWNISLVYSYIRLWFDEIVFKKCLRYPRCSDQYHAEMTKRPVCVVTGPTSGLGRAAAEALAREGFCVVLAGISTDLLSKTVEEIKEQQPDAHLKAIEVDLSSFQSILKFKNSLRQWLVDADMHPSIQLLINNAGILETSTKLTIEGYERSPNSPPFPKEAKFNSSCCNINAKTNGQYPHYFLVEGAMIGERREPSMDIFYGALHPY